MKKLHILMGILLGTTALQAQEPEKTATQLDRTVVVENLYNPDIMNANKINIISWISTGTLIIKGLFNHFIKCF